MEALLLQNLPRETHPANKGKHGTFGSPRHLPSWVIARRKYKMVLSLAKMALSTEDSPHATFPRDRPWTIEGSL